MADNITIIYPVKDIAKARDIFTTLLGVEPTMVERYYVGYRVGNNEIGLNPNGFSQGMTGPVAYWDVKDLKETIADMVAAGAELWQNPRHVGGGKQIAMMKDPDGNVIGLVETSIVRPRNK